MPHILIYILVSVVFAVLGYLFHEMMANKHSESAKNTAKQIIELARKEADTRRKEVEIEAKDKLYQMRHEFDSQTKQRRDELGNLEKRLATREENIDKRLEMLEKKEKDIETHLNSAKAQEENIKKNDAHLQQLIIEEKTRLEKISSLTQEEAKQVLLLRVQEELDEEKAKLIKRQEEEIRANADKTAKEIISLAIQKCAAEHTVETTVSVVSLPSDEMKGRIIGREGRNIRALEMATGVDVIIDDTPEAVTISSFNPVRREVARLALSRLISDGRIHPGRIEEVVEKVKAELENTMREEGEKAAFDAGVHGLHPELVKALGRLKYRTSYGQNTLQHSKEVAFILGNMASELNIDVRLARRVGLLHDIGKSLDQQVEGTHARLGADMARKFNESATVINAIEAHHEETEAKNIYAVLAFAADAVSAARPGARRETLESYIKRLEKLESIANIFKGVEKSYAIQAGREIRVAVQPNKISDSESINLARDIRKKIEEDMDFPGQIKVTVIRETRVIEYAK
ncbi:MAG: ribonuclease Y [Candidatus Gygaella obscura]|nr:ribonuclease Y [Candidatus Gygaella obscura]